MTTAVREKRKTVTITVIEVSRIDAQHVPLLKQYLRTRKRGPVRLHLTTGESFEAVRLIKPVIRFTKP